MCLIHSSACPQVTLSCAAPVASARFLSLQISWCRGGLELYDLMLDPAEIKNLASTAPPTFLHRLNAMMSVQVGLALHALGPAACIIATSRVACRALGHMLEPNDPVPALH